MFLSKVDKVDLLKIIAKKDISALQQVKGIGRKTAELIIVELKDKAFELTKGLVNNLTKTSEHYGALEEAEQALMALGFNKKIAQSALQHVQSESNANSSTSEIVKLALKYV